MIDTVYQILLTIINKENQGYVSPTEFNLLAHNAQSEIFRGYFEDENLDKTKQGAGLTHRGYSNLPFNQRQRITPFAAYSTLSSPIVGSAAVFSLPSNLYFVEDEGVLTTSGKVIEELQRFEAGRLLGTEAAPSLVFPAYEPFGKELMVYPPTIEQIDVRYIREPKIPRWTYFVLPNGKEMFDPTSSSFQDLELHSSEMPNIVLRLLSHFGINLREEQVVQIAETLKDKQQNKDNQ